MAEASVRMDAKLVVSLDGEKTDAELAITQAEVNQFQTHWVEDFLRHFKKNKESYSELHTKSRTYI